MPPVCLAPPPLGRVETEKSGRMNEVHCPPSETDVEKAVHTPCTHRHSPDDKTIPTRPGGARRRWRKTGRPKQIGRASCRERGWQYVLVSVGAVSLKKKKN